MLLDNLQVLIGAMSAANAITGQLVTSLGATLGSNVIDLSPLALGGNQVQPQRGNILNFSVNILAQPTSAGAATVRFALVMADDAALTTNLTVLEQTGDIPIAALVTGNRVQMTANMPGSTARRYLGAQITIGTAVLTNVSPQFFGAVVVDQAEAQTSYKNGFAVT